MFSPEERRNKEESLGLPRKVTVDYPFKKEIDQLLEEIPLSKIKKARVAFEKWCAFWVKPEEIIEQIYRAFCSSLKTRYSYTNFKLASIILLYLYGYISEEEMALAENGKTAEIFDKHKDDLNAVKEINEVLREQKFFGHIPMSVSCLAIGASISFTTAVKSILDVVQRLHEDEKYRESLYTYSLLDWDEAILLRGYDYHSHKKGAKEVKNERNTNNYKRCKR